MTIGTGVVTNDFAQILSDMGRTVSWKKVTKTTDPMTGSETSTFAAASNLTVVYFKEDQRYLWDPSGPGTISRYDQITVDSITYYVEEVIQRYVTTVSMVDYVRLFKVA
jgi:hypothetical protein